MLATLFLQPPSFDGFDGGAGSRYQARREVRSFWFPTWLAQPAALVPGSRLVDAPPAGLTLEDVLPLARDHELVVMHTSTPSFASDARVAAIGRRVVLSSQVVASVLGRTRLREGWDREVRWGRCAHASQPLGHLGYALTFSTPLAVLALIATGFAPIGWAVLAASLAVRWAVARGIAHATGDAAALRALPLLPLRDLLTAAVWGAAIFGRRVVWRGEAFDVDRAGRLRRVRAEQAAPA